MARTGSLLQLRDFFSLWLSVILWSFWVTEAVQGLSPDGKALLDIKVSLIDSTGILSNWDISNESPCSWYGVECLEDGISVNSLNLSLNLNSLSGKISPSIGKLSRLEHLDLRYNNLSGTLPKELGNCSELQYVDLSYNTLISGTIPSDFGRLSKLSALRLSGLQLTGDIPEELGNLTSLRQLYLDSNILSSQIPSSLGNLSGLTFLKLSYNNLFGPLPTSLGSCRNLSGMMLENNSLEGSIPASFGQFEKLDTLNLADNKLTGRIPSELGNCTILANLLLSSNQLSGSIPEELGRLSFMFYLHVDVNLLSGRIPSSLGNMSALSGFELSDNQLGGEIPPSLGNLSNLKYLLLINNQLTGEIPPSLGNLSRMMTLSLNNNQLTGDIPPTFGNLAFNEFFFSLSLSHNRLGGSIPPSIGHLSHLQYLNLSANQLSGTVPIQIWKLPIVKLDLSGNRLTGEVLVLTPPYFSSLESIRLENNQLTKLPDSWASFVNLRELCLAGNKFTGPIPPDIGHVSYLEIALDLSKNNFTGPVPYQFGNLNWLRRLILSHNNLSGEIPASLGTLESLTLVDISFNNFVGVLPSSWSRIVNAEGNPRLRISGVKCGSQTTGKGLSTGSIIGITVSGSLLVVLVMISVLLVCQQQRKKVQYSDYSEGELYIWSRDSRYKNLTFQDLRDATIGSESPTILSKNSNSTVYKAIFNSGLVLAVKVLYEDMNASTESLLRREIETFRKVRHRNLMHLIGFCKWKNLKFLVLKFLNNGSLYHVLHEANGLLDWDSRYRIAVGTALGLEYLHCDCVPPILHRDVKSANILLDDDLEPHITDFGTAKFQDVSKSNSTSALVGTYGYIAPENGLSLQVNEKVDVYAFGVVLLELLTGKYILDPEFPEGMNLVRWVETSIKTEQDLLSKVLDSRLLELNESHIMQEMILVMKVAMFCINTSPAERPTMREVVTMLKQTTDSRPSQQKNIMEKLVVLTGVI
ncbi:hypothetical protein R1sor_026938 [Riccia sorocarpa]|uniref:non-specific serine/threonine protein kinase n=1 Tax=Riccia sorocarpa TaxID=122646 RepID=A0ABD3GG41_9MARC